MDLSESAVDVLPWLSVSHYMASRAVTSPAFSHFIEWPPEGSTTDTPSIAVLERMVNGALVPRGVVLVLTFRSGVDCDYVLSVMRIVSDRALPLATAMTVRFVDFVHGMNRPLHWHALLTGHAPRLQSLTLTALGWSPRWNPKEDVDLFGGVAPCLTKLKMTGVDVPLQRIPAFDHVSMLHILSFLDSHPSESTGASAFGGCSSVRHLSVRFAGNVDGLASALVRSPLRLHTAKLTKLDILLRHQRGSAVRLLQMLSYQGMQFVRAAGDSLPSAFPPGFTAAVLHTLPELSLAGIVLTIKPHPTHGQSHYHTFRLALPAPSRKERVFLIDTSSPVTTSQIQTLGHEIQAAGDFLGNVMTVNVTLTALPLLADLCTQCAVLSSLRHLNVFVDRRHARSHGGRRPVEAPFLNTLNFIVPGDHAGFFLHENGLDAASDVAREWVAFPDCARTFKAAVGKYPTF